MAKTKDETLRSKLDRFWSVLFLDENGRPKSAIFLYSFCLSLLFFVVYALSYGFLIDVIETALADQTVLVRNVFQSVLPGLAATVVCCAMFFLFPDKRLVPAAYLWLATYALAAVVTMLFITEKEEFRIFLYFFAMLVPVGLISGGAISALLFRRSLKRKEKQKHDAEAGLS